MNPVTKPRAFARDILAAPAVMPAGRWAHLDCWTPTPGTLDEMLSIPTVQAVLALAEGRARLDYLPGSQPRFRAGLRSGGASRRLSYRLAEQTILHSGLLGQPAEAAVLLGAALLVGPGPTELQAAYQGLLDDLVAEETGAATDGHLIATAVALFAAIAARFDATSLTWFSGVTDQEVPEFAPGPETELLDLTALLTDPATFRRYQAGQADELAVLYHQQHLGELPAPTVLETAASERVDPNLETAFAGELGSRRALALSMIGVTPPLRVIEDYGEVQGGDSRGHHVRCENGSEYLLKGRTYSPQNPYVAVNELISARLARYFDLPVLEHDVAELEGELFFASGWMNPRSFAPFSNDRLAHCANRDAVYTIIVFDAWLANTDRFSGNLFIRRDHGVPTADASPDPAPGKPTSKRAIKPANKEVLLINDHGYNLTGWNSTTLDPLASPDRPSVAEVVARSVLVTTITDRAALLRAIEALEALDPQLIEAVVFAVPPALLPETEARAYVDFLLARQALPRQLLDTLAGQLG